MPPTLRRHGPLPDDRILVPARVGYALDPTADRSDIPAHVTNRTGAPFSGELREEQGRDNIIIPNNGQVTGATLMRPWLYVGWAVDPGNAAAAGLSVRVRFLTARFGGLLPAVAIANGVPAQAVQPFICGVRAEIVISNTTGARVTGVRAAIWGMSER